MNARWFLGMLLAGLFLCSFCLAGVCSGSTLTNPGFESGDFSGWTIGGTSTSFGVAKSGTIIPGTDVPFTPAFVNVRSGTFAAFANVDCGTNVGCTPRLIFTLSQVVTVLPNSTYSVGFFCQMILKVAWELA